MNAPLQLRLRQREAELRLKLAGIPDEFKAWRARATEGNALRKNHSQIERLWRYIEALQGAIEAELGRAVQGDAFWIETDRLEKKALIVHMIWDEFRSRLSLRLVSPFNEYLALADAYARECYLPVYRNLKGLSSDKLCSSPMIGLGLEVAPQFKADSEMNLAGLLTPRRLQSARDQLPLTVVEAPWSYLAYLPHMALIAHELGHAVERTLGLTEKLDQAVEAAVFSDAARRPAWLSWRREVFADWYGCATGGPPFVQSLAEHQSDEQTKIAKQTRPLANGEWTLYPTATVRILFCSATLRAMTFNAEADAVEADWKQSYPENPLESFVEDFPAIHQAFNGVLDFAKPELDAFCKTILDDAEVMANLIKQGGDLGRNPWPARHHVAAARRLVQSQPADVQTQDAWRKLLRHHFETMTGALAGPEDETPDAGQLEAAALDRLRTTLFADL